jgi:integrase
MAGQIIKRGDRIWLLRVYVGRAADGKRNYLNKTVRGTKKEADQELRRLLTRRDTGQLQASPKETVSEYLDSWLKTTVKPSVRSRTYQDYSDTLKRYVRPHLGDVQLARVTPVEIRAMLVKLRALGLSARTVRKAHEVIRNALEQAVSDRLIPENPARGRLVRKALPQKERKERQTVPVEAVSAFLAAAGEDRLFAYWCVLLFGGLRPSEALALLWEDVQADTVNVQRILVDRPGLALTFAPPKSQKSRRAVVLPTVTVRALREHRRQQIEERLSAGDVWQDHGLVFCNAIGQPLRQDQTRSSFKRLLKAAQLPPMRIYDLRHSNATLLLGAGEDLKVVSERLGHSTIALTADVYSHVSRGMQERAASKLDALVPDELAESS